jgi:hypothetical protein
MNTSAYAGGNPVSFVDSLGLDWGVTIGGTVPGGTGQITVGPGGVQVTGGVAIPGGIGAEVGLGKFQPPSEGVINGHSEITIKVPPVGKIICDLEKLKVEAKFDRKFSKDSKFGFGISAGTTQTATGPVIPWSQILPH